MDKQTVEEIYNLLLIKYELKGLYNKFIFSLILSTTIKESFYWLLILFSKKVKINPELINRYATIIIMNIGLYVPINRYFTYTKARFIEEMRLASSKHFNEKLLLLSKKDTLEIDLIDYNNILDNFNDNLESYIVNLKNRYDIPVKIITILVIAISFKPIIVLFIVFTYIVNKLNKTKTNKEQDKIKNALFYDAKIRNFTVNGKNNILNDNFNDKYLLENNQLYEKTNRDILELNNNLELKVNTVICLFILLIIWMRSKDLNQYDFLYYFFIIYDIEFTAGVINDYYKIKINYTKMQHRLNYLNKYQPKETEKGNKINIDKIIITKMFNTKPKLDLSNIVINNHILINGKSGSGKTSLLYTLKGIVTCDELIIEPNIKDINANTFLTLATKNLPNGSIYDIISNFTKNPDINLIKFCLEQAKLNIDNNYVVDNLSAGEKLRLYIASIIYEIKTRDYKILLFDEIDQNLNDELAYDICKNLKTIFSDKIILYITHNEKVKSLFNKKLNL
jgi:ABC-type lipoprotein export system ATPase subunit